MSIEIVALGAEIRGVSLARAIDDETFAAIERAYNDHGVIFFHDQHITPPQYRPAAPAEESSSLTTVGSTACRGCSKDQPRSLRSTVGLLQPPPGWPSHV